MAEDVAGDGHVDGAQSQARQGTQGHMLRKLPHGSKNLSLVAFLCFSSHSQFRVVKPKMVNGMFQLARVATIYSPEYDLVDFQATTSHLWGLWTSADGQPMVRFAAFNSQSTDPSTGWNNVVLENSGFQDISLSSSHHDPRQAYLQELFHPGRFSFKILAKTVNVGARL